jgi:Domain of unknown function (DUF4402)
MNHVPCRVAFAAATLFLLAHAPLSAQGRPLTVTGTRNLAFGTVIPGVAEPVTRTDPVRSGEFRLRGERNSVIQFTFVLPASMAGPSGATLPLSFGATDAGFSPTESITNQVGFDPRAVATGRLSNNGRGSIFLGGTANPGPAQRAGAYSATITLTVSYTGL